MASQFINALGPKSGLFRNLFHRFRPARIGLHYSEQFSAADDLFIQDAPWPRFARPIKHDVETWRVIDDWPARVPVTDTEIDVFEAWFGDVFDELFGPARCGKEIADMTVPLRAAHSHLDWRSGVIVATAAALVLAIAFIAMR